MSDTTPPIPKSGGNGPFILAAVVMLLLMGGLIFWKMKGGAEAPKAQEPPPSATQNVPTLDEAPPPPPPVASDSAAPDTTKPNAKKLVSSGGGPCGPCQGDASPAIVSALHAKGAQARSCYEHALRQNSMLAGHMSIKLTINQSGQVCNSNVASNELGDPSVANCVLQMMRGGSFPAPTKGCVEIAVPLNFTPKT
ncbi:MAG TPA: AgmX/PglI C-terminal domain-containing protein [Polyangiaceae bacterium]|nr:AgmX/PglI C-terminal domain-containing protein [Polyangiaceae bacterium]